MDITGILKTVAPWIGTALGSPLAGMAIEAASTALGLTTKTTDSLKQALSGATPEQMLALKEADQAFAEQMQKLGFDHIEKIEELENADRSSARQREMAVHDVTPKVLASVVTLGFFGILTFMLLRPIPIESRDIVNIMLGSLGTAWTGIIAYYFGSSKSSDRKTELLAQAPAVEK